MEKNAQRSLPLIGFDRNQPFRRELGRLRLDFRIRHLDPAVVYHFGKITLIRPSSVEAWLADCSMIYPGQGTRDFWESVWNLAMSSWDYIDTVGGEPWSQPSPAFPLFDPRFWRGGRRNQLLFARADQYIDRLGISHAAQFKQWLDCMVRFQYGEGLDTVPMGMVSLALNAPSETYISDSGLPAKLIPPSPPQDASNRPGRTTAWRIPFAATGAFQKDPHLIHQVFFDEPIGFLAAQSAVLTKGDVGMGWLYLRTVQVAQLGDTVLPTLMSHIADSLGDDWGRIDIGAAVVLPPFWKGNSPAPFPPEPGWPWLGDVRAFTARQRGSLISQG